MLRHVLNCIKFQPHGPAGHAVCVSNKFCWALNLDVYEFKNHVSLLSLWSSRSVDYEQRTRASEMQQEWLQLKRSGMLLLALLRSVKAIELELQVGVLFQGGLGLTPSCNRSRMGSLQLWKKSDLRIALWRRGTLGRPDCDDLIAAWLRSLVDWLELD